MTAGLQAAALETGGLSRRAEVVAAELLGELDASMHEAVAALHVRFGGEGFATLARDLKSSAFRRSCGSSSS
jgi:hypothetical protein